MALPNFPVDHTAPKPVGGDSVTVKVPRWLVYTIVATLVLTVVYVLGTTIKERVTDPALDQAGEAAENFSEEANLRAAETALTEALEVRYESPVISTSYSLLEEGFLRGTQDEYRSIRERAGEDVTIYTILYTGTDFENGDTGGGEAFVWSEGGDWIVEFYR